jgi:hypothetical protein
MGALPSTAVGIVLMSSVAFADSMNLAGSL